MSGFGSQPFGSSPYGIGTPAVAEASGGKILRNASTGKSTGSLLIENGNYVFDDNGRLLGMDDVKQLVYLAVRTTKGSSAMRELGQTLRKIDRITSNIERRVDATLREAVKHLVDKQLVEVTSVTVEHVREGVVIARMAWRNLLTGDADTESVDLLR